MSFDVRAGSKQSQGYRRPSLETTNRYGTLQMFVATGSGLELERVENDQSAQFLGQQSIRQLRGVPRRLEGARNSASCGLCSVTDLY
jgi:hypothetical protein